MQATPQGVQGHPVPIWPPLANSTIACSVGWRAQIALLHGPAVRIQCNLQVCAFICVILLRLFSHMYPALSRHKTYVGETAFLFIFSLSVPVFSAQDPFRRLSHHQAPWTSDLEAAFSTFLNDHKLLAKRTVTNVSAISTLPCMKENEGTDEDAAWEGRQVSCDSVGHLWLHPLVRPFSSGGSCLHV